ncbi:MAG: hypothetical protein R3346_04575, partial [Candidatus Spechtbacterales bacterium]|nr:hypothetical protein [Candidatus Spechtbacterales bacterium]
MNQELQNYIKQMREQGYTDEQIREGLKKAGWNDEQVEAEITNTPNPNKSSKPRTEENTKSEPEKSPKKGLSKKMVTIIAGVVFILGAGGAFGALYTDMWNPSWDPFVENAKNIENDEKSFNDENQVKDEGETGDSVPDEEPLLSDEQEELAENKNFENKFFSFSYPGDWIVKDSTDSSSSPEELGLLIRTEDWNQGISITVRSSEQYIASPLEEDSNKVALRAAIENGDIESFIKESTFSCEDETLAFCRYTDYRGYFM